MALPSLQVACWVLWIWFRYRWTGRRVKQPKYGYAEIKTVFCISDVKECWHLTIYLFILIWSYTAVDLPTDVLWWCFHHPVKQQTALGCLHPILIQFHVRKPNPNIPPLFGTPGALWVFHSSRDIHEPKHIYCIQQRKQAGYKFYWALLEITVGRKCFVTFNKYGSIVTATMIVKKHERQQHLSCLWDTTGSITRTLLWKCAVLKGL